jgi:hypothetical protein
VEAEEESAERGVADSAAGHVVQDDRHFCCLVRWEEGAKREAAVACSSEAEGLDLEGVGIEDGQVRCVDDQHARAAL